jgi:hypothetical protein
MPISLVDDQGNEIDLEKADGGTLRKKLEEAISENQSLSQEVVTLKAGTVIEEHGLSLVEPDDLKGVAPDQLETKAKELHKQRYEARVDTVKSVLAERGLEGDELDAAVKDFIGAVPSEAPAGGQDSGAPGLSGLKNLGGNRPSNEAKPPPMDDPMGNLTEALSSK